MMASAAHGLSPYQMKDTKTYPACVDNADCETFLENHACFQYFCYPWKKEASTAAGAKTRPLELCRRDKDCPKKSPGGPSPKCVRNYDKRRVTNGVCVDEEAECSDHGDCSRANKGSRCCNGNCCSQEYFEAMQRMPCKENEGCQVSV